STKRVSLQSYAMALACTMHGVGSDVPFPRAHPREASAILNRRAGDPRCRVNRVRHTRGKLTQSGASGDRRRQTKLPHNCPRQRASIALQQCQIARFEIIGITTPPTLLDRADEVSPKYSFSVPRTTVPVGNS